VGQPSIFSFQSQALVLNFSQHDYIRAARSGLISANLALADARQTVAEDTALTYLAVDRDLQRESAYKEQAAYARRLVTIVQDRLDSGQDTALDLTSAKLTLAQINLASLRAEDDTESDQDHLARLTGLRDMSVLDDSIPAFPPLNSNIALPSVDGNPAIAAAYANAAAKRETAFGDARYVLRPQVYFAAQYNRYTSYNNYDLYYKNFQHNNAGIGVQITLPLFDRAHQAKAQESAADAVRAEREADQLRDQFTEGRSKTQHAIRELTARAEVALLDQQLAQQQLDVILVQLKAGSGSSNAPVMTPKEEQTSRIGERDKFLTLIDAKYQMRQAEINLLRQTGELESWLKSSVQTQSISSPTHP
jgi:outer membrane protein TolC